MDNSYLLKHKNNFLILSLSHSYTSDSSEPTDNKRVYHIRSFFILIEVPYTVAITTVPPTDVSDQQAQGMMLCIMLLLALHEGAANWYGLAQKRP